MKSFIYPNWPVPENVHGLTTTRCGGVSRPPFDQFNLADHVGDNPLSVERNRDCLIKRLALPTSPAWLTQIHSTTVIELINEQNENGEADAAYTQLPEQICTVMTADCLPVLFCSLNGDEVAAAHAGWRGLCNGILENTINHFRIPASDIFVWFGPAIGPANFEVGKDVRDAFMAVDECAKVAFVPTHSGKYLANIYQLAKQRLNRLGVSRIYGGEYCTVSDKRQFYSYRRDGITGRMATLIWFN